MHKQMIDAIGNKENLAVMNKSSKNLLLKEEEMMEASEKRLENKRFYLLSALLR